MIAFQQKLDFMKAILEQAESNGLVDIDVKPDILDITLRSKKIRIHFKSGLVQEIE